MRKYYDDDDETAANDPGNALPSFRDWPAEPLTGLDALLAALLGAGVFVLLSVFAFPSLNPETWTDAAVAAGIRPPADPFPGFWRVLGRLCYLQGVGTGNTLLNLAGRLCLGLSSAGVYLLLRTIFALIMRQRLRYAPLRYHAVRTAAFLGALCFACADPVWRAGQTFAPASLLTFMTVLVFLFFMRFLLAGRLLAAYASMFTAGLLMAETPLGFVVLAAVWGLYHLALRRAVVTSNFPMLNPVTSATAKWLITFFCVFGLLLGIALNCTSFILMKGLAAAGCSGGDLPLLYATHYWHLFTGAATLLGWVLGLGVCFLPFVVMAVMLPRALDEEQFLPYHVGALFLVTGLVCFSQLAMLAPLWFWNWSDAAQIHSPYVLQLLMLSAACSVAFTLAVFGGDTLCRNNRRLAMQRFADLREDGADRAADKDATPAAPYSRGGRSGGLVVFVIVALLVVAAVLPGRRLPRTRQMLDVIEHYAREVLQECGPVRWLFTDGAFDCKHELDAAAEKRPLRCLSMMADNAAYQQYLRTNGVSDMEDRLTLALGAPMTLRSWMRDKPARMKDAAIQLGFELWKRDGKELPACSGVLARPLGMEAADCEAGVGRAAKLADEVLALYLDGGPSRMAGRLVKELFLFVQWRISRLARMRAERADRAGQVQAALRDRELSDRLDDTNESLQKILRAVEKARETTLKQVTPREGLQLALARADFALAERYAKPILNADPEDPNANFGVGMCYYTQKQYNRAEEYLKRVLVKKPNEPAVWNNLAMICLWTKRYDEGIAHAKKALSIIPESAEVKDTLREIEKAKADAALQKKKEEKAKAGKSAK